MNYKLSTCFLVLTFFIFSSCKKIIIEIVPVIMYSDISIPNAGDITHFSFPSTNVGYAASDTNFIYKTIDGGKTWKVITNSNWSVYRTCKGIVFFDELNGFCVIGAAAYSTNDGGVNWTVSNPWYGVSSTEAFCDMTSSGVGIMGRGEKYGLVTLYSSTNKGQTLYNFNEIRTLGGELTRGRVDRDLITVSTDEDNDVYSLSYRTLATGHLDISGLPGGVSDFIYTENGDGIEVGPDGNLTQYYGSYYSYYGPIHGYDYYSIDNRNGLVIAVGDHTIVSNLDVDTEEEWNDVLDVHGNGFTQKFLRIRFSGDRQFYISGENGLIWKATI